jgi:acetyltransferase-like isoleucine patch superfamily enzyme
VVSHGSLVHRFVNASRDSDTEVSPVLEDNCVTAFGSVIVGGIRVGRGAYVGAGAVLTTDAKPGRLYLGVPAKDVGPAPSPFCDWPIVRT